MPKYFVQYHRVSVSKGIDTETNTHSIGSKVASKISQRCKKCLVLLYINKAFKKDKQICNTCYYILRSEHESGSMQIVWTENQKFWVFTNLFPSCARRLMGKEQPITESGYLDLNGKYSGQYTVWWFDIKGNLRVTLCL